MNQPITGKRAVPNRTAPNGKPGKNGALLDLLATLPPGRRRVALALIGSQEAPTYPEVAAALGIHLGSVHQHLRRIRLQHPGVYGAVMRERTRQLVERHTQALSRADDHSRNWHRKQSNRRYYHRFGRWPWQNKRG